MKHSEILKTKFTTVALSGEQYLRVIRTLGLTGECYCEGYTKGIRDFNLDGWYYKTDLTTLDLPAAQ